jgi:hypothetical protein
MVLLVSQSASEHVHLHQYGEALYAMLQPHARGAGVGERGRKRQRLMLGFRVVDVRMLETDVIPGPHPCPEPNVAGA